MDEVILIYKHRLLTYEKLFHDHYHQLDIRLDYLAAISSSEESSAIESLAYCSASL